MVCEKGKEGRKLKPPGRWEVLSDFSPLQIDAKKKQVEEAQEEVKKAEDEFNETKDAKAEA